MWRTFAVPAARVMYVQIHKNACTSLKWMMADMAGEDPAGFSPTLWPSVSEHDDIHDRNRWRNVPRLDRMSPEERAQIHPDNGWFVFAVVRDPRSRMFSAWQNKLLLENPGYRGYRNHPWYPRHPLSAETVVEDFAKFVDLFVREPDHRSRHKDGHFRDQTEMLHEDVIPYTKIYDIRELGEMRADLEKHLEALGWEGRLNLPRINDTPLRVNAQPFANGVREQVEKIYAADFEQFGDRWDYAHIEKQPAWTDDELREAEWRATFGRRIGYLRGEAVRLTAQAAAERKRANAQKARADQLEKQLRTIKAQPAPAPAPWTVRRITSGVRRRVRQRWLS